MIWKFLIYTFWNCRYFSQCYAFDLFLQNCHVQIKTTYRVQKADVDGSAIFVHHHWLPVTTMHNDMTSHKCARPTMHFHLKKDQEWAACTGKKIFLYVHKELATSKVLLTKLNAANMHVLHCTNILKIPHCMAGLI